MNPSNQDNLISAIDANNLEGIQSAIKAGASLSTADEAGFLPLHRAASSGHVEVVKQLLELKADPNAVDNSGVMPLHIAAKLGNLEMIEALADAGADIGARMKPDVDPSCANAEDIARRNKHTVVAQEIRKLSQLNVDRNSGQSFNR